MSNGNQPAFPLHGWSKDPDVIARMADQGGLTKREEFAKAAMQGQLANSGLHDLLPKTVAEFSLKYADDLLRSAVSRSQ